MAEIYNELKIDEKLSTSGVIPVECFGQLANDGFQLVINLLPDESEHAIAGEGDIVRDLGIEYVYIPVDFQEPCAGDFEAFRRAMDAASEKKIWVHCAANYRVTAFTSLFLQHRSGWTTQEADVLIAKFWKPGGVWADFIETMRVELKTGA